jgi:histo-blood group ABO system transferase
MIILFLLALNIFSIPIWAYEEKPIVIISASYNNARWYQRHLDSIFVQKYQNYQVIYIDDASTDRTADLVQAHCKKRGLGFKINLIRNAQRKGALANQYHAIHSCKDNAIIIILDADDWFAHENVLAHINEVYQNPDIWLTYGQFIEYPTNTKGFCCPIPQHVVEKNTFREFEHIPSHLRTFYAWLFKQIDINDLLYEGDFFRMTGDIATMFPMIEMARKGHFKFISDVLLIYNDQNALNDYKVSKTLQRNTDLEIRRRKRYQPLENPVINDGSDIQKSYSVGLLIVATGKYSALVGSLIESARNYFCRKHTVTFFVFTDGQIPSAPDIIRIQQSKLGWPHDTLMRFNMYAQAEQHFATIDYLFACDADMRFVGTVGDEILSERVATLHPGYVEKPGTYETNINSTAYVAPSTATYYFAGGFYGGSKEEFLKLCATTTNNIKADLERKYVAVWNDESHLNQYFSVHTPTTILRPAYCYPEKEHLHEAYVKNPNRYEKKLIALDKHNHTAMRE